MSQLNLPIEYQIWGVEQIAEYFGYSLDYTKKHLIKAPHFPPARPLPTDKNGERVVDKWAALDVIAYALAEDKSAVIYPAKKAELKSAQPTGRIMCTTIDWNDMSDLGLIQHLNEQILHPIGLAISRDPITGISEKVIVAEDGFFVYDSRTVAPINFDDQRIKQHLKKLLETKVASKKKEVLVELCRHKGIRVGKVIHLPTAIMDTEQPSDEFNEFFNDASIPFLCKESSMDEDAMLANTVLFRSLESLVVFYRSLPYSLLIRIDIQKPILTIVGSTWDRSTYCANWGTTNPNGFLSDTIDQAIEYAFPFADERKKLAFENRNAPTYESEDGLPF